MFLSSNPGFTRLQTPARSGVIAVDPSLIRLGSRVKLLFHPRVDRIKKLRNLVKDIRNTIFRAEDTGNSIRGARIDIWMPSCADAMSWGTQTVVAVWGERITHGGLVPIPRPATLSSSPERGFDDQRVAKATPAVLAANPASASRSSTS